MKTVFGLFANLEKAKGAVSELLDMGFSGKQINSIIQETAAKDFLDINRHEITVEKTGAFGPKRKNGLESLLAER